MKHLDEGHLMAYVDGELSADAVEPHLAVCETCRATLAGLRRARATVEEALRALPAPDVEAAADRVRDRIRSAGRTARPAPDAPSTPFRRRRPAWAARVRLPQAAVLVLLAAGGVAALSPASPLRQWLSGDPEAGQTTQTAPAEAAAPTTVSAEPVDGRLTVSVDVPPGTELQVFLVEAANVTVAASNASFVTPGSDGIFRVTAPGPVRVELPRQGSDVSVRVRGQVYVTVLNGRLEVAAPATQQSDTAVYLRIP